MIKIRNTQPSLGRIAVAIDGCGNLFGPLRPEPRARMYAAIENPTQKTWEDAHSLIIAPEAFTTLWQAVIALGVDPYTVPTTLQIVEALEAFGTVD